MRVLITIGLSVATLLLWIAVDQYFFCPRFIFEDPSPFQGNNLYNPYDEIDSSKWVMANLHAHSQAWIGMTNGKGSSRDVRTAYDSLGYGIYLVSNYHNIDLTVEHDPNFVPAYEHGYNTQKIHYLVIGNSTVHWSDYLLPQTTANKQLTLKELSMGEGILMINHPNIRNGFSHDDLKYLVGFDYMEVLSPYSNAIEKWDQALSSGKIVFGAGSDDTHDASDHETLGRFCTWVNIEDENPGVMMAAMKKGSTYTMEIATVDGEGMSQKAERFKSQLPRLDAVVVEGGAMTVRFNGPAIINLSGQNGAELTSVQGSREARYVIKDSDHYVRTTAVFPDGTKILLNPVFRYELEPLRSSMPPMDRTKSSLLGALGALILVGWGWLVVRITSPRLMKPGIGLSLGWQRRRRIPRNPRPAT